MDRRSDTVVRASGRPPRSAEQSSAGSGGVPVFRPPRQSVIPGLLLVVAVLLAGFRIGLESWRPEGPPPLLELFDQATAHTEWAFPVAALLGALGLVGLVLHVRRVRRLADEQRVLAAAAKRIRLSPALLVLRSARWTHGMLVSGVVAYPRGAVLADISAEVAEAIEPFAVGPLDVQWVRRGDHFVINPRPPKPDRLESTVEEVRRVFEPLNLLMPGVVIDQHQTRLLKSGELEQIVAQYKTTTRDIGEGFRRRVQGVLDAKAPSPTGYWSLKWFPERSQVVIAPSMPLPSSAPYPLLDAPADRVQIPLGLTEGGIAQFWNPQKAPHILAVGPTGTGKTIFINTIISGCMARAWSICIADPKELSFRAFNSKTLGDLGLPAWPGMDTVATTDQALEQVIVEVYEEMRRRYTDISEFKVAESELQPMLLVVDEAGELVERLNAYHCSEAKLNDLRAAAVARGDNPDAVDKPKGTRNPVLNLIWSLLRLGRQAQVFVLIATQRPDVTFIPGEARSNLHSRIGLGYLDGYALEMLFGTRAIQQRVHEVTVDAVTGDRSRRRVPGRATVDLGSGPMTVQTFWSPDPAKVITGELSATDRLAVRDLHQYVATHYGQWVGPDGHVDPAVTTIGSSAWLDKSRMTMRLPVVERPDVVAGVERIEDPALAPIYSDGDLTGLTYVRASELTVGQVVLVEVDCTLTPVRVIEIDADPFGGPEDLQLDFEIVAPDPRAGQPGVTTLNVGERVALADPGADDLD